MIQAINTFKARPLREVDVLVVGGGPAGITAAISAARNNAKTLLIERFGFLGGELATGLPMLTFHAHSGKHISHRDGLAGVLPNELQSSSDLGILHGREVSGLAGLNAQWRNLDTAPFRWLFSSQQTVHPLDRGVADLLPGNNHAGEMRICQLAM